jgi:magnesium-transporting ATPase (P-type)
MAIVTASPMLPLALAANGGRGPSRLAGLSSAEAQSRLTEFGPNEIHRELATSPLTLLARQFASPVIWQIVDGAAVG